VSFTYGFPAMVGLVYDSIHHISLPYCSPDQEVMSDFFACRVVDVWNSLPDTVSFASLPAFKRSVRTVDFSEFLKSNDV